jgi:predicted nuclease of predicted toxin-antitoxin system
LLCDENLDPDVALGLRRAGFNAIHIYDVERQGASDEAQLLFAIQENRAVITQIGKISCVFIAISCSTAGSTAALLSVHPPILEQ